MWFVNQLFVGKDFEMTQGSLVSLQLNGFKYRKWLVLLEP